MAFTVQDFRANLVGSGARPNLFDIQLTFPPAAADGNASRVLTLVARSASIPSSKLGTIILPYFGRQLKYPGDRTFDDWTITIINDENFTLRTQFEEWMNALNMHFANLRSPLAAIPRGYQVDALVKQYAKIGGPVIQQYKLVGAWPSAVSPIDLAWDPSDAVEEFQVTLQYQWWENVNSTT
jgi:T4-like virus tail tube protein gp19